VTPGAGEVLGILSLLIWTLILIVTVKYIFFLLRVDNRGEGGILALYTLVRLAAGKRSVPVLMLALGGAALFAGDAAITPAISVLSAVEGAELVLPSLEPFVLPLTVGILIALFLMQRGGTAKIARLFGPICVVWFLTLAGLGLWHMSARRRLSWPRSTRSGGWCSCLNIPELPLSSLGRSFWR
jgi:KUP system potassium uptake protein